MFVSQSRFLALQNLALQQQQALDALHRSMGIIEFDLQGTILHANPNFLAVIGYDLIEIQGQHHRLFVPAEEQATPEYQRFWQRLQQGDFFSGQFQRLAKGGKRIWIEATYNPIFDDSGRPYKVVKFASDITQRVETQIESQAKLRAIDQTFATIEFDPKGNILTANSNFCNVMGYSAAELKGQHHRLFVAEDERNRAEYRDFWQQLAQGKEQTGQFKRLGKQGQAVWIQASYIPIAAPGQLPHKVIKVATDISAQKEQELNLNRMVSEAGNVLQGMAQGDLTQSVQGEYLGGLERLKADLNAGVANLANALAEINSAVGSVANSAAEVSSASSSLSQRTQETAHSVEQTRSLMQETAQQVHQTRNQVQQARTATQQQQVLIDSENQLMSRSLVSMEEIKNSSEQITHIVSLIDGIAFQTNLLALNAAVEAARAGEHGRGFAVVAGEVRNLAQKSADAAKDIKKLIERAVEQSQTGVEVVGKLAENLEKIREKSTEVSEIVDLVGTLADHQADSVTRIGREIANIDSSTQENAAFVEQTSATAESLSGQASDVLQVLRQFKIGR
ncbi:MAG: PAS domain-containing methyl-accepting chemotaxis protein [Thiotrichales bacterium]|nr:PAS domain-containing methyl-accepting chemotaxis protein [Thiotrichales bacterium]